MYMKQFPVVGNCFALRDGAANLLDLFRGPLLRAPTFYVNKWLRNVLFAFCAYCSTGVEMVH